MMFIVAVILIVGFLSLITELRKIGDEVANLNETLIQLHIWIRNIS